MRARVAGVAAAVTAAMIQLVEHETTVLITSLRTEDAIGWLPQLEAVGQTATVYLYASRAVTFLLAVPLVVLLGYQAGQSLDASQSYSRIAGTFGVGGGVGFVAATVLIGLSSMPSLMAYQSVLGLIIVGSIAAATGIQFAFMGLAGAALAEFRVHPLDDNSPNKIPHRGD